MKARCPIVVLLLLTLSSSSIATQEFVKKDLFAMAVEVIKREEGFSPKVYRDTACCLAIGYGRQIPKEFGFDLDSYPETTRYIEDIHVGNFVADIHEFLGLKYGRIYLGLGESRKSVLISMTYQMGYSGVSKFKVMWSALGIEEFDLAGDAMSNSLWFNQTRGRAERHIETMRNGF